MKTSLEHMFCINQHLRVFYQRVAGSQPAHSKGQRVYFLSKTQKPLCDQSSKIYSH